MASNIWRKAKAAAEEEEEEEENSFVACIFFLGGGGVGGRGVGAFIGDLWRVSRVIAPSSLSLSLHRRDLYSRNGGKERELYRTAAIGKTK